MNALDELGALPALLTTLMGDDPHLLLVQAVAWLDPGNLTAYQPDPRYIDFDYDAEDDLTVGLYVCRECFPAVYASVMQLQWQGVDERHITRCLLEGISTQLTIPIGSLEELRYGPPVDLCGVDLQLLDPDDAENPPFDRLLPLFADFGLSRGGDEPRDVQQAAFETAQVLIQSLTSRPETVYQDTAKLLLWMFSLSGNTAVDYTQEAFWENGFDMANWTPEDVALINDINQEARDFITSALNGLQILETDSALRKAFNRNVRTLKKAVQKATPQKQKRRNTHARTYPTDGDDGTAAFVRYTRWPDRP